MLGKEVEFSFDYVSHATSLPLKYLWPYAQKPKSVVLVGAYLGVANAAASNVGLTPIIAQIAWQYDQSKNIEITDFTYIVGSTSTVTRPASGQKVVLRVRITP